MAVVAYQHIQNTEKRIRPTTRCRKCRRLRTFDLAFQARSLQQPNWIECIKQKIVGSQIAFASRLAPTIGLGTTSRNRQTVRPPSRAGSLLQFDRVPPQKQAGSQAAFASKLAPTIGLGTTSRNRSAVRPPSRAGSLPQKSKAAQLPAAKPPHSTMSASSSAFDLAVDPPATSEG